MEINTHTLYQRQGMGKLLAACLFGFCEAIGGIDRSKKSLW